ncbi:MAG: hypothetical protein QOE82_3478, partial [Thermoanaerobaculia bacterium]|nr:hypothetical protein [Thermoanaerobaculia bacterium]
MKRIIAVAVCALSFAVSLAAQTSASLTGIVFAAGHPLPGATVTISSPELQGTRSTVTGESGSYSFSALPPGQYTISFAFSGMVTHVLKSTLRLSQTTRSDAVMDIVEDMVIVYPRPSVIDTPEVSTNMTLPFIERLPIQRNQLATAQFAPGVNSNTLSNGQ